MNILLYSYFSALFIFVATANGSNETESHSEYEPIELSLEEIIDPQHFPPEESVEAAVSRPTVPGAPPPIAGHNSMLDRDWGIHERFERSADRKDKDKRRDRDRDRDRRRSRERETAADRHHRKHGGGHGTGGHTHRGHDHQG